MIRLTTPEAPSRRSDASRNRALLLAVATRLLASPTEGDSSMRAIAREAGVGIATVYRHFPTREALVEAVYRDQVARLTDGAAELAAAHPPTVALRRWMDLFGDWVATKNGMIDTLPRLVESGDLPHAATRDALLAAIGGLVAAGVATGELRPDVSPGDISAALIGAFTVADQAGDASLAGRLLDLLVAGLRA